MATIVAFDADQSAESRTEFFKDVVRAEFNAHQYGRAGGVFVSDYRWTRIWDDYYPEFVAEIEAAGYTILNDFSMGRYHGIHWERPEVAVV